MKPTDQDLRALAHIVHAIRPDWDTPGIQAILTDLRHLDLAPLTHAATVAATTRRDQRTPAIIALSGDHWNGHDFDKPTPTLPKIEHDPRDWKGASPEVIAHHTSRLRETLRNSTGPQPLPRKTNR